ncbi:hypothetical protein [Actinophytocola sp.]|uniref:hypothetical protein n=1 Tax=Actinophytocola sp. TaxID=1872138 RepID=UPI00389A114D
MALDLVEQLNLPDYHATRADLLRRLGHIENAVAAYDTAAALAPSPAERDHLTAQATPSNSDHVIMPIPANTATTTAPTSNPTSSGIPTDGRNRATMYLTTSTSITYVMRPSARRIPLPPDDFRRRYVPA